MSKHISFFNSDIEFRLNQKTIIRNWLDRIAEKHHKQIVDLTYVFCTDEYLLQINNKFLNHDTYTDIITFDLGDDKTKIQGEIYISIPRVKENAIKFKSPFILELQRVIIHGLLHLCGLKDKTKEESQKMRESENQALSLLSSNK